MIRLHFLVLLLILLAPLAQAEVEVTDDLGNRVVLQQPARRIISLAPHNTENLFSAHAGQWLVGTVDFSDYPPQAKQIPRIGNDRQVNYEAILDLKPDLVVVWASGNPAEIPDRLKQLGLTLFYSEPKNFAQVLDNIYRLAKLAGTEKQVTPPLKQMLREYSALKERYRDKRPVSVFYQVWDNPLITLNGNQLVSHAIEACGGRNVFADLPILAPRIDREAVLARNPDVILLAADKDSKRRWADGWQRWKGLKAVSNHSMYGVEGDLLHRHTARFLQGVKQVCEILDQVRQSDQREPDSRKSGVTMGVSE